MQPDLSEISFIVQELSSSLQQFVVSLPLRYQTLVTPSILYDV